MKYEVNETVFDGINFPSDTVRQQFQIKYKDLTDGIGHVADKHMSDFLFTSYIYMLKARNNGDNRIATRSEYDSIKRFCRDYADTYDFKDNMLYDMAFGLNKYHKDPWDGYISDGRMKHIVKSEHSLKPRVTSSIDYNDLLNNTPVTGINSGGYIMEGKKYYIYMHVLNDEVIYVGKGSGSRRYFSHRSKRWKEIVGDNKALIKIEIVERYDDEEEAYRHEERLTSYYISVNAKRILILAKSIH